MENILQISSLEEMAASVIEELPTLTEGLIKSTVSEYTFEGDDGEILIEEADIKQAMRELDRMEIDFHTASLCGKDMLECAFDDERNEFVFWQKKEKKNDL